MIQLHYSNRMEALLAQLAAELRKERQGHWEVVRIVVANRQAERIIREHLALNDRIAANLSFEFLDGLVQDFLPVGARLVDRAAIESILLRRFRSGEGLGAEQLRPIRRYLDGAEPDRRLPQLAFKLAGLYEEYLMSRPEWFPLWDAGRDLENANELARCERALWQTVRADLAATGVAWLLPGQLAASLRTDRVDLPQRLHLFGMAHLAPVYQRVLDAIGRIVPETLVYALNPCREYWDDVKSDREQRRLERRLADLRSRDQGREGFEEDPYGLQSPGDDEQPLLRRWGRPGREKIHLLNELADWDFHDAFADPGRATLLAALQQDILDRQPPRPLGNDGPDCSLVVHACPSARREAEIIAESIWALLRSDAGAEPPLRFSDIAILVPSAELEAYTDHFSVAFGGEPALPFSPLQRGGGALHEVAEAFGLLLGLVGSPLNRAGVLEFVGHPAVARHFENLDPDTWTAWCDQTGIVRGADQKGLQPAYFSEDALSWDQGLRRLAVGAFMGGEGEPFEAAGQTYAPREIGTGTWEAAGTFILEARGLLGELQKLKQETHTLKEWSRRLAGLLDAWIGGDERYDVAALARLRIALLRLAALEPEGLDAVEHPFDTAAELARQELQRVADRASGSRVNGVALADPDTLRGLPFRVLFVAGLGEGIFPGRDAADAMDLRARQRLPGDVPAHERDRYLFLEALLSARERLILSYVARDSATGEELQTSPLIDELLGVIRAMGVDPAGLVQSHRLLRWDPERFREHPELLPAAPTVFLEAAADAWRQAGWTGAPSLPDPAVEAPFAPPVAAAEEDFRRFSLSDLRAFLESPLQGSAKAALGLGRDEDDPGGVEEEPAATAALRRVPLLKQAFWTGHQQRKDARQVYDQLRNRLERDGQSPLGSLGQPERTQDAEVLQAWAAQVPAGSAPRLLRLGGAAQVQKGLAYDVLPPLVLEVPAPGGRSLRVELTGALEPQGDLGAGPGSLLLLNGKFPKQPSSQAKRVLRAWLDQLVLAAGGTAEEEPLSHAAYFVAADGMPETPEYPSLAAVTPEQARQRLVAILRDLLFEPHAHLLPLEAVTDTKGIPSGAALERWIEEKLDNPEHARLTDLYGPVPHPLTYPAAGEAALMARRNLLEPVLTAIGGEE